MEIQNDEWHAVELLHGKDLPKDQIRFRIIPKENGKELPKQAFEIAYKEFRCLAAIITEIVRDVESR